MDIMNNIKEIHNNGSQVRTLIPTTTTICNDSAEPNTALRVSFYKDVA